jgi:iron complex outermembrane recepter protein
VKQDRADLRAEVETGGGLLQTIRLRAGYADYKHSEINAVGAIGTTFLNKSIESRLELVQTDRGGWKGAIGGQVQVRDFNVIGDEAFVPKNVTRQFGVFTLQSFNAGAFKVEVGGRYEHTAIDAVANATIGNPDTARLYDAFSGSVGASYEIAKGIRVGLSGSHSERAPAAEELFANGPHAGTQSFEIGDPDFLTERSNGVELSLRGARPGFDFSIAGYASWFDNYIYDTQTGAIEDGLPVFQYRQASARYYGIEGEASVTLGQLGDFAVNLDGVADYTNARITGIGPVPRIPPFRILGGIEAQSDAIDARAEVEYTAPQKRIAAFETPTARFTIVNASIAFKPFGKGNRTSIVLAANNIFDVEARRHASFLKDFAPLSGRDIRISGRVSF